MKKILNYIGGEWRAPLGGAYLENMNPSRGTAYSLVSDSRREDVDQAVEAASLAFPAWAATPPEERARILRRVAAAITVRLEEFARAESIDNGKPLSLARRLDIPRSVSNFEFFAEAITGFRGEEFRTDPRTLNVTEYSPLGPVACISPWNLPLYLLTWKIAPALAAGNTVVAKPSEVTPMTAFLLSEILKESGVPPGVLNLVHGTGPGVGAPLVAHPKIRAVSFTGSTATGRVIAAETAKTFKKASLEMGGKNPNIIFADADWDSMLETSVRSTFSNQGQICLCGSRIFVEKSVYPKFREEFLARVRALKVGDPLQESTDMGALVSLPHLEKVLSFIETAKREGGKILCGGERLKLPGDLREGYFLAPTLIEGLPSESIVNQEEIFGPVATLIPFETEADLLRMANSTRYGLAASVWTKDSLRARRIARGLESGIVWVNCWMVRDLRTPFGGVKDSGVGREGGEYALKFFSETKNICTVESL